MNKKITKSNYPLTVFLLLTHVSLKLFLLSSSLLFLSVKGGFKFICNGWFQFSKHTSALLIFKTRSFSILSDEQICVSNKLSFSSAAYPDFVCLRRDTFLQKIKNDYLPKSGGGREGRIKAPRPLVAPSLHMWNWLCLES